MRSRARLARVLAGPRAGLAVAALAIATVTACLAPFLGDDDLVDIAPAYLLVTLLAAALWGYTVGLAAAVVSVLVINYFFVAPVHTFTIQEPHQVVAIVLFALVAVTGAVMLSLLRRQRLLAEARHRESEALLALVQAVAHASSAGLAMAAVCHAALRDFRCSGSAIVTGAPWVVRAAAGSFDGITRADEAVLSEAVRREETAQSGVESGRGAAKRRHARTIVPFTGGALLLAGEVAPRAGLEASRLLRGFAAEASAAVERARLAEGVREAEGLRRADELRTLFLSGLSHDLRTPLTAIKAAVGSLQGVVSPAAEGLTPMIETIDAQTDRLAATVTGLLEIARIEGGKVTPVFEPIEASLLLSEVAIALRSAAAGREIRTSAEGETWLRADYGLLFHSLLNLGENAARYSTPGGAISLTARRLGHEVLLTVSDEGPGIPEADAPYVFERFYRGSNARGTSGSGLGLALARAMTELCRGRIELRSPPAGTCVTLAFPAVAGPR